MAELRDRVVVKLNECIGITDIDAAQDGDATFGSRITNIAQLLHNLIPSFCKFAFASCAQKYARTRNRKETTQLQTNTQTSSGNDRGTTFVQSR